MKAVIPGAHVINPFGEMDADLLRKLSTPRDCLCPHARSVYVEHSVHDDFIGRKPTHAKKALVWLNEEMTCCRYRLFAMHNFLIH